MHCRRHQYEALLVRTAWLCHILSIGAYWSEDCRLLPDCCWKAGGCYARRSDRPFHLLFARNTSANCATCRTHITRPCALEVQADVSSRVGVGFRYGSVNSRVASYNTDMSVGCHDSSNLTSHAPKQCCF